jgi:hypothetical protein
MASMQGRCMARIGRHTNYTDRAFLAMLVVKY